MSTDNDCNKNQTKRQMTKITRNAIVSVFQQFAGQSAMLVIPRPFIELCGGDHLAALLLSQILYWSERTNDQDGWFAKSYDDWHKEIGLTEYQIRRTIKGDKRRKNEGFSLSTIGVETKLKRSNYYGGAATLHYRVNQDVLQDAIWSFIRDHDNVQNGIETLLSSPPEQCSERSYTEITTKNTSSAEQKPRTRKRKSKPSFPAEVMNPLKDAIVECFGWSWDSMTPSEIGQVQKAAYDLARANTTPDDVRRVYAYCVEHYENYGPNALASNLSKSRSTGPAPIKLLPKPPAPDEDVSADPDDFLNLEGSAVA